jgi:hypothetical protein
MNMILYKDYMQEISAAVKDDARARLSVSPARMPATAALHFCHKRD